jgi:hypothetical protein
MFDAFMTSSSKVRAVAAAASFSPRYDPPAGKKVTIDAVPALSLSTPVVWTRRKSMALGLLALLGLNLAGGLDRAVDALGRGAVARSNDAYLDEAQTRAVKTFLILSALKAGLSILQSSELGVSVVVQMKVQVGKVIESLSDTVNAGWRISLAGLSALYGTKILLRLAQASSAPLTTLTLLAFLLALLAPAGWTPLKRAARAAGGGLLLLSLLAHLLLPLSVFLGSVVSHRITAPLADEAEQNLQAAHQELAGGGQAVDDRNQVQRVLDRIRNLSNCVAEKLSFLGRQVAQRIAVTVFDVFVFPLLFLAPSFILCWKALRYFFEPTGVLLHEGADAFLLEKGIKSRS